MSVRLRLLTATILLLAVSAGATELSLVSGGGRIIDRDPTTTSSNCNGWVFAPSPVTDDSGEVVAMYTASDALTNRCKPGTDPAQKFGDRIRVHQRDRDGRWSGGVDVIDRRNFSWMSDDAFLAEHPESFVAHLASPSVVKADGRYYMAFVGSVNDRNLCAGEHFAENICGSCFDPWSYFVLMWAVSDDGRAWRVRERARGDATLIGRAPDASEMDSASLYKGLTRVSLVTHEENGKRYFYFGTQFWMRNGIKMGMFRIERDPSNEWGIKGEPELFNATRREWIACPGGRVPDFLTSTSEMGLYGIANPLSSVVRSGDNYIALTSHGPFPFAGRSRWSQIAYYTSTNLIDWNGGFLIPSAIPFVADGYSYEVSVIDPIAIPTADGGFRLFFASADGDDRNGITRDGQHDCFLDPRAGPTAPYMGTGIYEAQLEFIDRRRTETHIEVSRDAIVIGDSLHVTVRVTSEDDSKPNGTITVTDNRTFYQQARVIDGKAELSIFVWGGGGPQTVTATFWSDGIWATSRGAVEVVVSSPTRKRGVRR